MTEQRRPGKYPTEMRARAVRMVREGEGVYGSEWEAICAVAEMLGPTAETGAQVGAASRDRRGASPGDYGLYAMNRGWRPRIRAVG